MAYRYEVDRPTPPASPIQSLPGDTLSVIDATPRFEFTCPTDPDNDMLNFAIEVDTVDTFDSGDLQFIESRFSHTDEDNHGYWDYDFDGAGDFRVFPTAGLDSGTYSGRTIRASFPSSKALKPATYYWRVLVSQDTIQSPANMLGQFQLGQGEINS